MSKVFTSICICLLLTTSLEAAPTKIRIWNFWDSRWLQPAFTKFEKKTNTKIISERLTWSGGFQKIITALAANQAPDIIELGSTWIAPLSASGALQKIQADDIKNKFYIWQLGQYKNKTYAIPWLISSLALFYNKSLFKKAHIKRPPFTWQKLVQDSQKINALSPSIYGYAIQNGQYTLWQRFLPYLYSNKGQILSLNPPRSHVNDLSFKQALQFYKQMYAVSLYDGNLAIRRAFQANRIGFMIEEPGQIQALEQDSPSLHFGVAPIPVPKQGWQSHSLIGGEMLSLTKNTKHPKLALALIRFLTKEQQTKLITKHITSLYPADKQAVQNQLAQNPHTKEAVFLREIAFAKSPPPHPYWSNIETELHKLLEKTIYENQLDKNIARAHSQIQTLVTKTKATQPQTPVKQTISPVWLWFGFLFIIAVLLFCFLVLFYFFKSRSLSDVQKRLLTNKYKYHGNTILFLLPLLILFLTFHLFPILYSFYLSFTHFNAVGNTTPLWVGLDNYQTLLHDSSFLYSVARAALFTIGTVPITMVIALFTAVLLHHTHKFSSLYQAAYFMPVMTSVIVIAVVFSELYAEHGLVNNLFTFFNLTPIRWLQNKYTALPSIMIMNIWSSFGFYTLILLASLRNIPVSFYEASLLEGASKKRQFFTITLPLLKPTLLVISLLNVLLAFQVFGEILIMTQGGPLEATQTVVFYIYKLAFYQQRMGHAAAAAYFVFILLIVVSLLQTIAKRRKTEN